jgi:hypothetical protein
LFIFFIINFLISENSEQYFYNNKTTEVNILLTISYVGLHKQLLKERLQVKPMVIINYVTISTDSKKTELNR